MIFFNYTKPKMIVADEGKQIRVKNDIYQPATVDEYGHEIPEHFPHYATIIFVPDNFAEKDMMELYVEETIESK